SRVDYQMSPKHSLFGRFFFANLDFHSTYDGKNPLTVNTVRNTNPAYAYVLGDTYLIGSGIVNSFRAGLNKWTQTRFNDNFLSLADLGMPMVPLGGTTFRFSVTGNGFIIGGAGGSQAGVYATPPQVNLAEDISFIKGTHQIGFGANYLRQAQHTLSTANAV